MKKIYYNDYNRGVEMKKITGYILMGILSFFVIPFLVNAEGLLTNLNVDGIGDLNINRRNYTLQLTTTLDYATISATPANENVAVEGTGNVAIVEGKNTLIVKATDGVTTEEYVINLTMLRPSGDATDGNPNTGAFASIGALIACLIVAIIAYLVSRRKRVFQI